jgi:hypothetical protein
METLYVRYENVRWPLCWRTSRRPSVQATVTDQNGQVLWKGVDSSIPSLIRDVKDRFREYQLEVELPSKPIQY